MASAMFIRIDEPPPSSLINNTYGGRGLSKRATTPGFNSSQQANINQSQMASLVQRLTRPTSASRAASATYRMQNQMRAFSKVPCATSHTPPVLSASPEMQSTTGRLPSASTLAAMTTKKDTIAEETSGEGMATAVAASHEASGVNAAADKSGDEGSKSQNPRAQTAKANADSASSALLFFQLQQRRKLMRALLNDGLDMNDVCSKAVDFVMTELDQQQQLNRHYIKALARARGNNALLSSDIEKIFRRLQTQNTESTKLKINEKRSETLIRKIREAEKQRKNVQKHRDPSTSTIGGFSQSDAKKRSDLQNYLLDPTDIKPLVRQYQRQIDKDKDLYQMSRPTTSSSMKLRHSNLGTSAGTNCHFCLNDITLRNQWEAQWHANTASGDKKLKACELEENMDETCADHEGPETTEEINKIKQQKALIRRLRMPTRASEGGHPICVKGPAQVDFNLSRYWNHYDVPLMSGLAKSAGGWKEVVERLGG